MYIAQFLQACPLLEDVFLLPTSYAIFYFYASSTSPIEISCLVMTFYVVLNVSLNHVLLLFGPQCNIGYGVRTETPSVVINTVFIIVWSRLQFVAPLPEGIRYFGWSMPTFMS